MKLVVDMNLTPDWVAVLTEAGHSVVHWSSVGSPCAKDEELVAWARDRGYIVFTHDLDFGAILAATDTNSPSVVQMRTQNPTPEHCGRIVLDTLGRCATELAEGALVSIDERRARVRLLPLKQRKHREGQGGTTPSSFEFVPVSVNIPTVRKSAGQTVRCPEDVVVLFPDMASVRREMMAVAILDAKNRLIDRHVVSIGTADTSWAHLWDIFRHAVVRNAWACVLVHNHPRGDLTPSAEDVRITRQMVEAGRAVEINVIDHIIIGRERHVSLREEGLVGFG